MKNTQATIATPNHAAKTFTIRKDGSKYRTFRLKSDKFKSCLNYTENDWNNFLRYSEDYYVVK
jgi:hypothetical protein